MVLDRMHYLILSAIAGSITSLAFLPWRKMSWMERGLTLFVGASFGLIFVPWAVADLMHVNIDALRAACAITYMGAIGANSLIPLILKKVRKVSGLEEEPAQ